MGKKINIVELLKDCPKGMELDCTICNDVVTLEGLDKEGYYPIKVVSKDGFHHILTCEGCVYNHEDAKCVIFPKGKTTWEGFVSPCKFKDGDVIYNQGIKATAIFYKQTSDNTISHCFLNVNNVLRICHYHSKFLDDWRLATEEEKQKLFDAIKANEYKWNAETKTLEKLVKPIFNIGDKIKKKGCRDNRLRTIKSINNNYYIIKTPDWFDNCYITDKLPFDYQNEYELVHINKFDIKTLKTFESKVLVRYGNNDVWRPAIFGTYIKSDNENYMSFVVVGGSFYDNCIPYEGNEHLLGTTNDCDEYFKSWKN